MNGIDISEALAWLIIVLTTWSLTSIGVFAAVEKGAKPILKQVESVVSTWFPTLNVEDFRRWATVVAAFGFSAYTVVQGDVNLLVDNPLDLFQDAPQYMIYLINTLLVAAGAFLSHEEWERVINASKKAKEISDLFFPPQNPTNEQLIRASMR